MLPRFRHCNGRRRFSLGHPGCQLLSLQWEFIIKCGFRATCASWGTISLKHDPISEINCYGVSGSFGVTGRQAFMKRQHNYHCNEDLSKYSAKSFKVQEGVSWKPLSYTIQVVI